MSAEGRQNNFNLWSTIGINYSTIGTPLSVGTYLAFNIGVGGSPVYIFGYILATVFQMFICVSLAEMAGAYPHSTGQVFWTSVFAPPRYSRVLSYWVGAFTSAAWFFWTVGTYLFAAQLVLAMATIGDPSFEYQQYQVYLCYLGAALFAVLLNTYLFRGYSLAMRAMMLVVNGGAITVFIVLLVRASPKRSAHTVFVEFVNATGWTSDGFVFLLGCLPGITAVNGFDSSAHIADEIPDPARQVPKVMIGTSALASLSGLPMAIIFMLCVVNEDNLLAPIGGQPIAQLFYDSCASTSLSLLLMFIYVFVFFIACGALTTTFSRVLWSLAMERHVMIGSWLSKLRGRRELPENAVYFAALLACLIGLLCLGPTTALNAILGSAAICFFCSYMVPIVCLLINRDPLRQMGSTMNLGIWGVVVNSLALAWMVLMSVVLVFPQYLPVNTSNMNYTIAVLGCVAFVYGLNWIFYARKHYRDPKNAASGGDLHSNGGARVSPA
ncbi:putative choline and nitrogen mustard permease [Mariannaea sp. PMI_226]|nr:putative choline and nitrogen mustard permease [Mariannaea sp. PMI_226]